MSEANDKLDEQVMAAIKAGHGRAGDIEAALFGGKRSEATMRSVDRALQRLRKRGRIRFEGSPRTWRRA